MKKISVCLAIALLLFRCTQKEDVKPQIQENVSKSIITARTAATTFFVSTTGNDAADGSAATPWKTLKYAVSKTPANLGYTIQLAAGTYIENGLIEVPLGVSVIGAGIDQTIIKSASSFYYYPASPDYATDKFLISLNEYNQLPGNQTLSGFTIDGDGKKLHGGIYVRHRNNVTIDGVKIINTHYIGMWLWDVQSSFVKNSQIINSSWGSSSYCVGALSLGNLDHVEISNLNVDENTGYGIKAIGPSGGNNIFSTTIHDSHVSVSPFGQWNNGSAPNIAIELWSVNLVGCQIYNTYVDNTISLINNGGIPSSGIQTIRVHHNTLDMDTRAHGAGYAIELTIHDAEVDHNYFLKGTYGIANWADPMKNWNIHHNTFYGLQNTYPGEIVRSQWSGLHNVKLYNNTVEFVGTKTMNVIGLYGGTSDNIDIKNNLLIDNSTSYSYYADQLVHMESTASLSALTVQNNLFQRLPVGSVAGTYSGNLTSDPLIALTGARPDSYYTPKAGSPLIDGGLNVGYTFLGKSPEIGAMEIGAGNALPQASISSPVNAAKFTSGSSVTITANASDTDGTISKVEFFNGTTLLGQALTSPYSFLWSNVPTGSYSLTVKATDNQGGITTSTAVAISVSAAATNQLPAVSLASPSNNATYAAGSSVTLAANATDSDGSITKVEFFNGTTKLGEDLTSPYSFIWSGVPAGKYSLTAKATDNQNGTSISGAVAISVTSANQPPIVNLLTPVSNATYAAGSSVTLTANATDSDGSITKVEFFNGTTKLGEDLTSPYSFIWSGVLAGKYSLTAKATDNQNGTSVSGAVAISVMAANQPPIVSLLTPVNNSVYSAGTSVTITASAVDNDGSVAKVEFFNGTTKLGEALASPYSFVWSATAGTLSARVTDNAGATATSNSVTVTLAANNPRQLILDSNDAVLSGKMVSGIEQVASGRSFFYVAPGSGTNYYIPPTGAAAFNFQVDKTDNYVIWAKVKTPSSSNQSSYVYNGKGKWFTWSAGVNTTFTWSKITDSGSTALFPFTQGANQFQIAWNNENVQVDQVLITNDVNYIPSN